MLRLVSGQVESLWDEMLPVEVRELPEDLAALDVLLRDRALLEPIAATWRVESVARGRPTISMASYVRLMVVKQRTGWGYEALVREVSDSIHLRRFCLIALGERVPDESTVRKLTRWLGTEVVNELTRCVMAKAQRETRFRARAMRIDSTVVEADVRYPSDSGLTLDGARSVVREAKKLTALFGAGAGRVRDRTRAIGRRLRMISKTMGRRTGERKQEVLRLTNEAGEQLGRSLREARRLAVRARRAAGGRGASAKLAAVKRLEESAERAERVVIQIKLHADALSTDVCGGGSRPGAGPDLAVLASVASSHAQCPGGVAETSLPRALALSGQDSVAPQKQVCAFITRGCSSGSAVSAGPVARWIALPIHRPVRPMRAYGGERSSSRGPPAWPPRAATSWHVSRSAQPGTR